jgi:hypothetical protein
LTGDQQGGRQKCEADGMKIEDKKVSLPVTSISAEFLKELSEREEINKNAVQFRLLGVGDHKKKLRPTSK